jgi:aspartyl-tRNA(Asn)/glutamyl-tRNA(Gln) amidotransferase subunit C
MASRDHVAKEPAVSLSEQQVRHVARLARLGLTDDEVAVFADQLSDILGYAEQVGEVAAEDVPPTVHPFALKDVTRPDEPRPSLPRQDILAGAPEVEQDRFAVPRIVAVEGGAELEANTHLAGEER